MHASGFSRFRWTSTVCLLALLWGHAGFAAGTLELTSRVDPGALSDTGSGSGLILPFPPAVSRDGRYVAFLSVANNLVPGQIDLNTDAGQRADDLFLYDRVARTTTLVSHAADSPVTTGDDESLAPAISADGRWVVYPSLAANLVDGLPDDGISQIRLFLWDRISGSTTLVSSSQADQESGCGGCGVLGSAISGDGRYVAFSSDAPDLVPGQPEGDNVFLWDRTTGKTALVSRPAPGSTVTGTTALDFSLSADGRFVAFNRHLQNPPGGGQDEGRVFLYDRVSGEVTPVGPGAFPAISADGSSVALLSANTQVVPGQVDRNGQGADVFLYSRATRTTLLVSHAAGQPKITGNRASELPGTGFLPTPFQLSADGRFVVFQSFATDLVPRQVAKPGAALFVFDRGTGTVTLVSRAGGSPRSPSPGSDNAAISADGRFITFDSPAVDLVTGQRDFNYSPDVFLFDLKSGRTTLVSARSGGTRNTGSGSSYAPMISADGSTIAFYSSAPDLMAGVKDLNSNDDLIVYDVSQRTATVGSLRAPGMASRGPDADSFLRALSADGRWVLFEGGAANLAPGQIDLNGQSDVFLYDHTAKTVTLVSHAGGSAATAADGPSLESTLSTDGQLVAFASDATNLDPTVSDWGDTRTGQHRTDVFLFDRATGKSTALSRSARHPGLTGDDNSAIPVISADGRWVAFTSRADDLAPATDTAVGNVYLYDRVTGVLARTNVLAGSLDLVKPYSLSADGRYLAALVPGPRQYDLYLYDRVTGTQTLVSHAPDGTAAGVAPNETPTLSADGRFVAFTSDRSDLGGTPGGEVNVYLWDRTTNAVTLAGPSDRVNRGSQPRHPHLSADGRWLAFLSNRSLVPGPDNPSHLFQVYLYDRITGALTLVDFSAGLQGISADGHYVVNGLTLYDRIAGTSTLLSNASVDDLLLSADGHSVAFQTRIPNLVPGDYNGVRSDVFLLSGVTP